MCTVIVHVPEDPAAAIRVLAVRDEDPLRAWDPLGPWWPELPGVIGVRDTRAGGAWLAADPAGARLAVVLNRADLIDDSRATGSRGHIVLDAASGRDLPDSPATHGFNLLTVTPGRARVSMWDGEAVRTVDLAPGVHMIAHDDVDDPKTARIAAWHDAFAAPSGEDWVTEWLAALERTTALPPTDDRAIIRDNRPHGYPTLSLLVCAASVSETAAEVVYGELDEPGAWNSLQLR
ncbi:NRDE family protein [Microbacterium oleivorans]|uniref:NRDE family protein n=1 Tax=Microbacterium oleivorans TaxID=273677 RepID=UPI00203F01C3|nr:NRDE family protein [Microbacterium oleivorans]MCM3695509.1 NRDE family protein [Microbacterium oleivorans]